MAIYWFILCVFLIFLEVMTVNLVSIWFAIGAFVAMIVSLLTDALLFQVIAFALVSLITLLATKPLLKGMRQTKIIPTNYDRVLGQHGEVIKKISSDSYGEVKVIGTIWTAVSDDEIDVGEKVIVKRVDGVKLVVEREEK